MKNHITPPQPWYQPVRADRVLNRSQRYDAVEWNNETLAIEGFRLQLDHFYITPAKRLLEEEDGLFMSVALTCILIDTLAQYEAPALHSNKSVFMSWLKKHVPTAKDKLTVDTPNGQLAVSIDYPDKNDRILKINDYAAAVYYGYRCGILHEAHPYMFCGIAGQYRAIKEQHTIFKCRSGLTRYQDGSPCPTVVLNPSKLLDAILNRFKEYFELLNKPESEESKLLLVNFKRKFLWSHGIEIGNDTK
jgi:hypothetical protein